MLYIFNNIKEQDIFYSMLDYKNNPDKVKSLLLSFGIKNGLTGNLWRKYILYTFIYNDNPYTRSIERGLVTKGSIDIIVNDYKVFYDLYYENPNLGEVLDFKFEKYCNSYILALINEIEGNIKDDSLGSFIEAIEAFYRNKGLADMAIYKAFRVDNGVLKPIKNVLDIGFDSLIGYDYQKNLLKENTECFLNGLPYNNVLLYGDSGTGKSTSIKALLNTYFDKGLRIIEVYKHQMQEISKIINKLKTRPYYYIIYMDDLSFEEDEVEYKYLKSIIEGGIEPKPNNVAVYATSNRRHLIKEVASDNATIMDDLHRNETQAEKLSLAYRFGLQIYYGSLSPKEFRKMVLELAKINNIEMEESLLLKEASAWELTYGSLSGRCAAQFISYITNKIAR